MKLDDLVPEVVEGHLLLDELHGQLVRYVVLPSPAAADAVVLWIAATHAQPAWEHASRLVPKSPLRRCGKTRLLEVLGELVHKAMPTTNISVAALVRSIDESDPPTLILDEADAIFAKRRGERSEGAEDLRGILNAGHSRGWPYIRWDMTTRAAVRCPTFAMAAVAAIGDLPDTIEDRAVVINMQRRAPGQHVAQFRRRRALPVLNELRERLRAWILTRTPGLAEAVPDVPVEDRAADVWEPLIAVAAAAGSDWPDRARRACLELTAASADPEDGTAAERLLGDLREVFEDQARLPSAQVIEALTAIEDAPWGDWYGHPLRARDLARLLRPYGIKPRTFRVGNSTPKGYERRDFEEPWARYTRPSETSATSSTDTPERSPLEPETTVADRVADRPKGRATQGSESGSVGRNGHVADVVDVSEGYADLATPLPLEAFVCRGCHGRFPRTHLLDFPQLWCESCADRRAAV